MNIRRKLDSTSLIACALQTESDELDPQGRHPTFALDDYRLRLKTFKRHRR